MTKLSENFSRNEFKCKCGECNQDTVDYELIKVLENIRKHTGNTAITITSGNRCKKYNTKIGGRPGSYHLQGRAADIVIKGVSSTKVYSILNGLYPNQYGIGVKDGSFVHIDTRDKRVRWTY